MTLLHQIQQAAMDPSHGLADLLRKCLTLSYRLKHQAFREWVQRELNGYPDGVELPPYRRAIGDIRANVSGMSGSSMNNVPVPLSQLPQDHRESLRNFDFRQSVGELESLAGGAKKGTGQLMRSLPMELCAKVQVYEDTSTVQMWSAISASVLSGVLDQIRTRALQFALEIQELDPAAGEATGGLGPSVSTQQVSQIFYNVISAGTVNMAGSQNVQQIAVTVREGDLESLVRYLTDQGVVVDDVEALKVILADESAAGRTSPGPKAQGWIRRTAGRIASGTGRVAESTASAVLTAAVKGYLGLP